MSTFATRLNNLLNEKNIKQAELVEKTGIGKSSISTYLSGEYEPKQQNVYKIAQALDVSINYLMGFEDEPEPQINTIAAHAMEDLTAEEIDEVLEFIKFQKMKRKSND